MRRRRPQPLDHLRWRRTSPAGPDAGPTGRPEGGPGPRRPHHRSCTGGRWARALLDSLDPGRSPKSSSEGQVCSRARACPRSVLRRRSGRRYPDRAFGRGRERPGPAGGICFDPVGPVGRWDPIRSDRSRCPSSRGHPSAAEAPARSEFTGPPLRGKLLMTGVRGQSVSGRGGRSGGGYRVAPSHFPCRGWARSSFEM